MARFRFALESFLKLRRLEEDRAERSLLDALRALRRKEAELGETLGLRESARSRCLGLEARSEAEEALRMRRYASVLFRRAERTRREVGALASTVEELRREFHRASARRQAVEKLRQRRWREFQEMEEKREMRRLDEAALVQAGIGIQGDRDDGPHHEP